MRFFDFVPQNIEVNRLFRFVLVLGLVCTICEARSKYCDLCDNHIACSNSGVSSIFLALKLSRTLSRAGGRGGKRICEVRPGTVHIYRRRP